MDAERAAELLAFTEASRAGMAGLDAQQVQAQLEARHADVLGALDWFAGAGRADEALRLANALVLFWMATKRIGEGDAAFARALAVDGGDAGRRGLALAEYGYLIFWAGDDERSAALAREAVESGREAGEPTTGGDRTECPGAHCAADRCR